MIKSNEPPPPPVARDAAEPEIWRPRLGPAPRAPYLFQPPAPLINQNNLHLLDARAHLASPSAHLLSSSARPEHGRKSARGHRAPSPQASFARPLGSGHMTSNVSPESARPPARFGVAPAGRVVFKRPGGRASGDCATKWRKNREIINQADQARVSRPAANRRPASGPAPLFELRRHCCRHLRPTLPGARRGFWRL